MQDFRRLKVWAKAHALTLDVYQLTDRPIRRDPALVSQIRRAASSVAANIVEGCGRRTGRELSRYLQISFASAAELEYHLILARDLRILPAQRATALVRSVVEFKRMLASLMRSIAARDSQRPSTDRPSTDN